MPTEQIKLLQHLFLRNASGADVDFPNNTFKHYFKKIPSKLEAICPRDFAAAMA